MSDDSSSGAIRIVIDTLVLPRGTGLEGERVANALRETLSALFSSELRRLSLRSALKSGELRNVPALDGGVVRLEPRARPERTGARVAERVAAQLRSPNIAGWKGRRR